MFDTDALNKNDVRQSLKEYENNSCVKFVEMSEVFYRQNIKNHPTKAGILVESENSGCWAHVGRTGNGPQFPNPPWFTPNLQVSSKYRTFMLPSCLTIAC